jgi:hypothetical protein
VIEDHQIVGIRIAREVAFPEAVKAAPVPADRYTSPRGIAIDARLKGPPTTPMIPRNSSEQAILPLSSFLIKDSFFVCANVFYQRKLVRFYRSATSAWGLDDDRRGKPLIYFIWRGSISEAFTQS